MSDGFIQDRIFRVPVKIKNQSKKDMDQKGKKTHDKNKKLNFFGSGRHVMKTVLNSDKSKVKLEANSSHSFLILWMDHNFLINAL